MDQIKIIIIIIIIIHVYVYPWSHEDIYHIEVRCSMNTPSADLYHLYNKLHNFSWWYLNKLAYVLSQNHYKGDRLA